MNCPKCANVMREREREIGAGNTREVVVIDACPNCGGVWLDKGELEKLTELERRTTAAPGATAATGATTMIMTTMAAAPSDRAVYPPASSTARQSRRLATPVILYLGVGG